MVHIKKKKNNKFWDLIQPETNIKTPNLFKIIKVMMEHFGTSAACQGRLQNWGNRTLVSQIILVQQAIKTVETVGPLLVVQVSKNYLVLYCSCEYFGTHITKLVVTAKKSLISCIACRNIVQWCFHLQKSHCNLQHKWGRFQTQWLRQGVICCKLIGLFL